MLFVLVTIFPTKKRETHKNSSNKAPGWGGGSGHPALTRESRDNPNPNPKRVSMTAG